MTRRPCPTGMLCLRIGVAQAAVSDGPEAACRLSWAS
jgi:hypothetical protein